MSIEIKGLRKEFNKVVALDNIDLNIPIGKSFGILGRNGAGKTTIIRILLGIYEKDKGEILYNDSNLFEQNIRIGYLPEERGLYLKHRVDEQLKYFGSLKGLSKAECEKSIRRWLNRLGIDEYYSRRVEQLSKGNKQKIQLISALIDNPEIVILDEPFSGLDPVNVELFKSVFKELLEQKKTIIFSSHRIDDVEEFCDRVVLLNKGKIIESGEISKIKENFGVKSVVLQVDSNIDEIFQEENIKYKNLKQNEYKFSLEGSFDISYLIKRIVENNVKIKNINIQEVSLNQIFLEKLA